MPRGVRRQIDYNEELQLLDAQILKHKNALQSLQEKRSDLVKEKERRELQELSEIVQSTGMSVHELIQMVHAQEPRQEG